MPQRLRAAVIGAGKIGRHHAKWYHRSGCELAGWSVSTPDHLDARAADLRQDVPEIGRGFTSTEALLDALQPDLVSVCTPAEHHFDAVRQALQRGLPVLCEKPLVWSDDPAQAADQAAELQQVAAEHEALLAVNLQYSYAARHYRTWLGDAADGRCEVVLESRGKGAERAPDEVWMELGPHALSLAEGLLPEHQPVAGSLTVEAPRMTAIARFTMRGPGGEVATTVRCGQKMDGDLARRFGLGPRLVDYAGRNNAAGEYSCYLSDGTTEREYPDLMRTSIEQFVATVGGAAELGVVDGAAASRNLAVQLQVAEAIKTVASR